MRPRTLSASSLDSYAGCPARFEAEMARLRNDSEPGIFGTAIHTALDEYIDLLYFQTGDGQDGGAMQLGHDHELLLDKIWPSVCDQSLGMKSEWIETGVTMLTHWLHTRPLPYRVLSREVKESFDLVVPGYGEVQPVTYICDRVDQREDGTIEIIDYKTQWANVSPTKMYQLIQPGLYAAALRRKYGETPLFVTYDMLRYDMVSVPFTDTDIDGVERFLGAQAKIIWDDDEPQEKINPKCSFCPRKGVCETLQTATEIGWTPTLPIEALIEIRDQVKNREKALKQLIIDIDDVILAKFEAEQNNVFDTGKYIAQAAVKRNEVYDPEVVLRVLGDDAIPYLKVGKTALDRELKRKRGGRFTPEQADEIRSLAQVTYGEPYVTVEAKGPVDIDE